MPLYFLLRSNGPSTYPLHLTLPVCCLPLEAGCHWLVTGPWQRNTTYDKASNLKVISYTYPYPQKVLSQLSFGVPGISGDGDHCGLRSQRQAQSWKYARASQENLAAAVKRVRPGQGWDPILSCTPAASRVLHPSGSRYTHGAVWQQRFARVYIVSEKFAS